MNCARAPRQGGHWLLAAGVAAFAVGGTQACNSRFDFDAPSAGSNGLGGAGGALAGAGGGTAGTSGVTAGTAGLPASGGACGVHPACPNQLHCVAGECSECAADADCKIAGLAHCDETHRCVACLLAADCPDGSTCDSIADRCLPTCHVKADCPVGAHGCNDDRLVCYQCDEDRECETSTLGPRCASDGSGCVQCRGDADCPMQHCDVRSGHCVQCRDWRDCASGLCNPSGSVCLEP